MPVEPTPEPQRKVGEVAVKPLAFGEGGTKGTFVDEKGQVYKSVVPTVAEFVDGKAVRTPKPEWPTQEYEVLQDLQDLPNVVKIGKKVSTNEGDAFEVETLKDAGKISYDEYRKIEETVQEINNRNIQIGDHVSVMRRENGELVINDFSTASKDRTDARDSDYLGRTRDKLSPQDKDVVETEDAMKRDQEKAEWLLKPSGVHEYYLTQRPPSIGTHPVKERVKDIEEVDLNGRKAWLLTYKEPLTPEEIRTYELTPKYDPALLIGKEVKGYTLKTDKAYISNVGKDNTVELSTYQDGKLVKKEVSGKYFNQQIKEGKFEIITPTEAAKPSEVKPEIPIENGQEEKGRLQVTEPVLGDKVPVETQAPITETKAESVNPIEVPKEEPSVVSEKPVTPTEGNRGKIIEPHKEVSISQVKAVEDVVSGLNTDMKPMEASMLYSTVKNMDLKSISSENGTEVITIKDKIKEKLFKSLDKKGYVSSFGDGEYSITPKGEQFIERVKKRTETRKGVKDGTDLFPDMAGIPEFKPIYEEIKTQVSDGTIKRITDKDVNELESVTADIERKAESADEAGLVEAIKQADELITEPAI